MKASKFVIDPMPGHVFNGFTQGETWNGWACPFFTYDEAQKIVAAHAEQGLKSYYDEESDSFAFEVEGQGGDYDVFTAVEVDGMKLYPVGARYWIWEEHCKEGLVA